MSVLVLLDELSFSKPKTEVLRYQDKQHLYYALTKGIRIDAVRRDSGALLFMLSITLGVQQGLHDLPRPLLSGEVASRQR